MKTFTIIWIGQLVSIFGSGVTSFAFAVWVFERTGSATFYALLIFVGVVPNVLFSPFAGALVDRWNPRAAMILSDAGAGSCTLIIALLVWTERLEIWQLFVILAISSLFRSFQMPAFNASIARLVAKEDFGRASGMSQLGPATSQVFSPLLAGAMLVTVGLKGVLLLDICTFLFAVVVLLAIRIPWLRPAAAGAGSSLWQEAIYGWRVIKERPGLLGLLLLFAMSNFTLASFSVLLGPLILSFASAAMLGSVLAVASSGALLGGFIASAWGVPKRRMAGIFGLMLLQGVILVLGGLRPNPWLILATGFVFLFSVPIINACSQVIWLSKVAKELQGRVFAIRRVVSMSALPFAYLLSGPLAEHVFEPLMAVDGPLARTVGQVIGVGPGRGVGLMFITLGLLILLAVIVGFRNRHLRQVEELPDAVGEGSPAPVG